MKTLKDKVRAICHSLKMETLTGVDPNLRPDISSRISSLPSPEQIQSMGNNDLSDLSKISERLMADLDRSKNGRTMDFAIRHNLDKGIPPRMSPILGCSENWYKRASIQKKAHARLRDLDADDYSKALSPAWNVVQLKPGLFQLKYTDAPILDFSLTKRPDGRFDGDIEEVKVYGMNYWKKVPEEIRFPMVIEIFSRAKDILDSEKSR